MGMAQPSSAYLQAHPYQPVQSDESQADLPPRYSQTAPAPDSTARVLSWRPFFLRRVVLLVFIVVFVLVIAAIEGILAVSNKNHGIATGRYAEHYLWTYGPTAFLTVVAAYWARTEYQSKLAAPWIRLSQPDTPTSRTLLLNYVHQFPLLAICRSLRHGDFTVSIAGTVSILVKILVVISTGLLSLSLVAVTEDSYPMVLQDSFLNSKTKLASGANLAWYDIQGQSYRNLTLPDGISGEYAFQSVETNLPESAQTRVTVDGLANTMDCEPIELGLVNATFPMPQTGLNTLNLTLTSPGCNVSLVSLPGVFTFGSALSTLFARFEQVQCDGVTGDAGKRVLVMFGNLTYTRHEVQYTGPYTNTLFGALTDSTQMFCVPTYNITRVEVVRNRTQLVSVQPVQGALNRTLDSVTAWDIMEAQFAATQVGLLGTAWGWTVDVSSVVVDVDLPMQSALNSSLSGLEAMALMQPKTLQQIATDYYQRIGAIITKGSLMESALVNTAGSATVDKNRLIVSPWAAQWMVALLAVCVILTAMALPLLPTRGFLPCSPNSLHRLLFISLYSCPLLEQLRLAGAADDSRLAQLLGPSKLQSGLLCGPDSSQDQFRILDSSVSQPEKPSQPQQINSKNIRPTILSPACLSILGLTVFGLVIALELLLRKSNLEHGLGNIKDNTYIHYTWTAIPALTFGLLATAISAVDFETRSLTPYMALTRSVSRDAFTELEFLDMTIPEAMYREIKLRKPWALITTTALLIASVFTVFSASLFQESYEPITTSINLQATRSFSSSFYLSSSEGTDVSEISSLILASNYSFPRLTYDNLAFPELVSTAALPPNSTLDPSTLSISAVIPALRGKLDCRLYDSTQIQTNLTLDDTPSSGYQNPLIIGIGGENCDGEDSYKMSTYSNTTYFGIVNIYLGGCSDTLHIWGRIDFNASPVVQHVAALGCNTTFEGVDVNTTFIGTDLSINTQSPPQPLESTVRNTTSTSTNAMHRDFPINLAVVYLSLAKVAVYEQLLQPFFSMLVTSPWAIPLSALGDPSANAAVASAIESQLGIILAQTLATQLVPANTTNATLAGPIIGPEDNDARPVYHAAATTTTAAAGRRRVVQDAASTHVLAALLLTVLALLALSWAVGPRTDVLPRRPATIASAVALIAGGNIPARLTPAHRQWQSPEEVVAALGGPGARFWMGWGVLPDDEGQVSGGENQGGVSQFGLFVVSEDDATAAMTQWRAAERRQSQSSVMTWLLGNGAWR